MVFLQYAPPTYLYVPILSLCRVIRHGKGRFGCGTAYAELRGQLITMVDSIIGTAFDKTFLDIVGIILEVIVTPLA